MKPLGNYPALRRAGPVLHVSGMSARLAEGGCAGVQRDARAGPWPMTWPSRPGW